ENGYLEKVEDFEHNGEIVYASRLGYRITGKFIRTYFGRVFENPDAVFNNEMLQPETQDIECFVDGVNNIVEAQKRVAEQYFKDGSYEAAAPQLKVLLNIMANGTYEGKTIDDPELRNMFTYEYLVSSDWYHDRLLNKQLNDIALTQKNIKYLTGILEKSANLSDDAKREINEKIHVLEEKLKYYKSAAYLKNLEGYIGLDAI
ncbi:MAG TPA: hypothetical protein PL041_07985, partial [Melioribacteraceae bacterium]|nr:hypothetical protein [Melioribacteraceae bacterium]